MSIADELETAIKTLQHLRENSPAGPWQAAGTSGPDGGFSHSIINAEEEVAAGLNTYSAELVDILYRTIGFQISLMREAMNYASDWEGGKPDARGATPKAIYRKEILLARAINGEVTA
jgi:hypothetical protein